MNVKSSARAQKFIKDHEGLRLKSYPDPGTGGEPWTIGYGHTSDSNFRVAPGQTITREKAEELFLLDLSEAEEFIIRHTPGFSFNRNELGAVASLAFNIGNGNPNEKNKKRQKGYYWSGVRRHLNNGDGEKAMASLSQYRKANGRVLPGLVRRRSEEIALFNTPDVLGDVVIQQDTPITTQETRDARDAKRNVDRDAPVPKVGKDEVAVGVGGVLLTVLAPFMSIYRDLQSTFQDQPYMLAGSVLVVAAIGYIVWRRRFRREDD